MKFTDEEIEEFRIEATELLDSAEQALLSLDRGAPFQTAYSSIFRALHSIKGAAGMMEMTVLQTHLHELESRFTLHKDRTELDRVQLDYFLRGVDAARTALRGDSISFDYANASASAPAAALVVADALSAAPSPAESTPSSEASTQAGAAASSQEPVAELESLGRVLVIDDEPDLVEVLTDILRDAGFEVDGITHPELAMDLIAEKKPDVVLTDISMPKLTGMDLLALIAEKDPYLPVVFLSGNITKELLIDAIQKGVHGVLEKPFDSKRVIEACVQAAHKHRVTRLFRRSLNLLLYQFSDLSEYLAASGKHDVRAVIEREMESLLDQRRLLRQTRK